MADTKVRTTELVVAGFDGTNTAFLARAALARLQQEWGLASGDVAIVLREADGQVVLEQTLNRSTGRDESSTLWEMFADLFFAPESLAGTAAKAALEQFAAVGIDPTFMSRTVKLNRIRLCKSTLLVRTKDSAQREKVVGLLQGFDAELAQVPLGL